MRRGVESLAERELLAMVLRSGRPGESAIDLAGALLAEYGGLAGLASARPEELAARPGVGPAKAAAVVAAFRLGHLAQRAPAREPLRSAAQAARVAMRELAGARRERLIVLVCDSGHRLRQVVAVAEGWTDRAPLPVREILNAVLRHDGRAFAVAHNHPGGDPTPTAADAEATRLLSEAAKTVGVRLLDHLVVADREWSSATAPRQTPG